MINANERTYTGTVNGHEFEANANGTLTIARVSDFVRDEARLLAATEFLLAGRVLGLSKTERDYWSKIRNTTVLTNLVDRSRAS